MLRQQYMEKLAGWRADRLILSMNQLQMSVQVIESLGGRQKGLHLMNIDYSTVLNVGLSFRHTLWMVSLLGKFFKVLSQWCYLRNLSSLRSFHDATLIQLNALLLSWITLLYISQRYVPMLKRLLITSASKIFALRQGSSLNFSLLIHWTIIRLKKLLLNSKHGLKSTIY